MNLSVFVIIILLLASCSQKPAPKLNIAHATITDNSVVAKVGDKIFTQEQLDKESALKIYQLEEQIYKLKMDRVKLFAIQSYISLDPRSKGLTSDEYFSKYIGFNTQIEEKEIHQFMRERGVSSTLLTPDMKTKIIEMLMNNKKEQELERWLAEQSAKTKMEVSFQKPSRPHLKLPVRKSDPSIGAENAKHTIVEIIDLECPFSAKGDLVLTELRKKMGKELRIVTKFFPLPFHKLARESASYFHCVYRENPKKAYDLKNKIYTHVENLTEELLVAEASKLGLSIDKLKRCVEDNAEIKEKIEQDFQEAQTYGIDSTPVYLINGRAVQGSMSESDFSAILKESSL